MVSAPSLNSFKNRLDKFWSNQDIMFNYKSKLHYSSRPNTKYDKDTRSELIIEVGRPGCQNLLKLRLNYCWKALSVLSLGILCDNEGGIPIKSHSYYTLQRNVIIKINYSLKIHLSFNKYKYMFVNYKVQSKRFSHFLESA